MTNTRNQSQRVAVATKSQSRRGDKGSASQNREWLDAPEGAEARIRAEGPSEYPWPDEPRSSAAPEAVRTIKRELAAYTKAAKWRSRTGPQEDATVLWDAVERLQLQLQEAAS